MKSVFLFETKTSSEDLTEGSTFWKRTNLDPQLSLYLPALRTMGYNPRGAIYDCLLKPSIEPYKATPMESRKYTKPTKAEPVSRLYANQHETDETPENYGARCMAAIEEAPNKYYKRGVVVRLESDEREAALDVWQTADQMRNSRRLNVYPKNPDSCIDWGRECDYLNVCAGMADINDPVLFQKEAANVELDGAEDLSLLTQSAMRCYRKCQKKHYYRNVLRQRPLKKPETLSTGSSVHAALETYRVTGGDLVAARAALLTTDPFIRAKEDSMIVGYAAYWGTPVGFVAIEKQFKINLVNPETGGISRTWSLGGKVDAIVDAEVLQALLTPAFVAPEPPSLETLLKLSVEGERQLALPMEEK